MQPVVVQTHGVRESCDFQVVRDVVDVLSHFASDGVCRQLVALRCELPADWRTRREQAVQHCSGRLTKMERQPAPRHCSRQAVEHCLLLPLR